MQKSVVIVLAHGERKPKVLLTDDLLCVGNITVIFHGHYFIVVSYFYFISDT